MTALRRIPTVALAALALAATAFVLAACAERSEAAAAKIAAEQGVPLALPATAQDRPVAAPEKPKDSTPPAPAVGPKPAPSREEVEFLKPAPK
jgi:hypothetical protein